MNGLCAVGKETRAAVTDADIRSFVAKVLRHTRVINKSTDQTGICNFIRGIIHEHLGLKGGVNATGQGGFELLSASCLSLEILVEGQQLVLTN